MMDDPVCRVTYDLKPVTGGIEVTLTVDDMPLGTRTAKEMDGGGMSILANLKSIIETGRPPMGIRMKYGMFDLLEFVLPKKAKSEHWPLDKQREKEPA